MLPRTHIVLGAVFVLIIHFIFPNLIFIYLATIFLSSVLIDVDNYAAFAIKSKKWKLSEAFEYHKRLDAEGEIERKKGIYRRGDFHPFHTLEFHILVLIAGLYFPIFIYVFIGMLFHSLCDLVSISHDGVLHRRYFFLTEWIIKNIK